MSKYSWAWLKRVKKISFFSLWWEYQISLLFILGILLTQNSLSTDVPIAAYISIIVWCVLELCSICLFECFIHYEELIKIFFTLWNQTAFQIIIIEIYALISITHKVLILSLLIMMFLLSLYCYLRVINAVV